MVETREVNRNNTAMQNDLWHKVSSIYERWNLVIMKPAKYMLNIKLRNESELAYKPTKFHTLQNVTLIITSPT